MPRLTNAAPTIDSHADSDVDGRPPNPAEGSVRPRHDLVVIGDALHVDMVLETLRSTWGSVLHVPTVEQVFDRGHTNAIAYVLVTPLPEPKVAPVVRALRSAAPVFVVVPEVFSDERARRLYEEGTRAVVEWPHDALLLPQLIRARLHAAEPDDGSSFDADDILARSIRTRLWLWQPSHTKLEVCVTNGVVQLQGHIGSESRKLRVVRMIEHVPGVHEVHTEDVSIVEAQRVDLEVERDIERVLDDLGDSVAAVSFSAEDGAVILVGTVPLHDDLSAALEKTAAVQGVVSVKNYVTVSPTAHRRALRRSREVGETLEETHPDCNVDVTCIGRVAVVRGRVPRASNREEIVDAVADQDGVEKVVDRLVQSAAVVTEESS